MDQFFQTLRKIQKKERNNSTLARVEENFYQDIHNYLDELRKATGNDPFSDEYYLLKDTQRIATEICERREHKITDAAVVNIHRSYHVFAGKPKFDLVDTTPLNLTPEEEKFYFSLIDVLTNHKRNISLEKFSEDNDEETNVSKSPTEIVEPSKNQNQNQTIDQFENPKSDDEVLKRLDKINNAKIVKDEKVESIEKQISKSQNNFKNEEEIFKDQSNPDDEFIDFEERQIDKLKKNSTVLLFDDIDPIIGVDEKIYGPFKAQDLVVMPKINAKPFIKNRKGRFVKI